MTNRVALSKPELYCCPNCGGYNPRGFASCSGCGESLISDEPIAAAATIGTWAYETDKAAGSRTAAFSTAPMWPLWTTSDEQRLGCALVELPGFAAGRTLIAADRKTGIAVDENAHKVCVFEVVKDTKRGGKDLIYRRIAGYESIAEVGTVDGVFRRPITKATGTAEQIVALLLRLEKGEARFEALINLMAKPQAPGGGNHRAAMMRAKEWQAYLIGLMHLPGLLAFNGKTSNGGPPV